MAMMAPQGCKQKKKDDKKEGPSVAELPVGNYISPGLIAFKDKNQFDEHIEAMRRKLGQRTKAGFEDDAGGAGENSVPYAESAGPNNEMITNNQEKGVDEGGIVKNIGDSLIVLRQGVVYVSAVAGGTLKQSDAQFVAPTEQLKNDVWYDEMLVSGDRIYVIGFRTHGLGDAATAGGECPSKVTSGTEINSFRLADGKLVRLKTTYLRSYDYYSNSDYASRMVDGKMVLSFPVSAFEWCEKSSDYVAVTPKYLSYDVKAGFVEQGPLFSHDQVIPNIEDVFAPVYHTTLSCDLPDDGSLSCKGSALISDTMPYKYVTPERIYLMNATKLFAVSLHDMSYKVHAVKGRPLNQFSFAERGDVLHLLTTSPLSRPTSPTPNMMPEMMLPMTEDKIELLQLPLADFDAAGQQDLAGKVRVLSSEEERDLELYQNRFVGDFLTYATSSQRGQSIHAIDLISGKSRQMDLSQGTVSRLEAALDQGLFVALESDKPQTESGPQSKLTVMLIDLKAEKPDLTGLDLGTFMNGESRSHGFFARRQEDGSALIGLAVLSEKAGSASMLRDGSLAGVAFIRGSSDYKLTSLGTVVAGGGQENCASSCVDWYGNTRPIFLSNRIFGLTGNELIEASLMGDKITEVSRMRLEQPK
jgi:hypothetical protein